ncbi:9815_t:CDS:2, partial [Acaulospora morrowiae]
KFQMNAKSINLFIVLLYVLCVLSHGVIAQCPRGQICTTTTTNCGPQCTDSTCADTNTDTQNCGTCGHACEADEYCVDGVCVDCVNDSDCVSDYLVTPDHYTDVVPAAGTCINNVCYVCAGCLDAGRCGTFENTGGTDYGYAQCKTNLGPDCCNCCRPRDLEEY